MQGKECMRIYDKLYGLSYQGDGIGEYSWQLGCYCKLVWALICKLFEDIPQDEPANLYYGENEKFFEDKECKLLLGETNSLEVCLATYGLWIEESPLKHLLHYYDSSPNWDLFYYCFQEDMEDMISQYGSLEDGYLKMYFPYIKEEDAQNLLKESTLMERFTSASEEYSISIILLSSAYLGKYLTFCRQKKIPVDDEVRTYIDDIVSSFPGESVYLLDSSVAYFFLYDGVEYDSYGYYRTNGLLDVNLQIVIAGVLLDERLRVLNKNLHFSGKEEQNDAVISTLSA